MPDELACAEVCRGQRENGPEDDAGAGPVRGEAGVDDVVRDVAAAVDEVDRHEKDRSHLFGAAATAFPVVPDATHMLTQGSP